MKRPARELLPVAFALTCGAAGVVDAATACTATTGSVAFGAYSPISNASRESTGSVDVNCTATVGDTVSYAITLTAGTGAYANRQLASGADCLAYNLFSDSARALVWGDGTGGTSVVSDSHTSVVSPTPRSYTVFGRIPSGQTGARMGTYTYTDNVTVTVTY